MKISKKLSKNNTPAKLKGQAKVHEDIHKPHVLTAKEIKEGRSSAYKYAF